MSKFIGMIFLLVSCSVFAVEYPSYDGYVNDFANIIFQEKEELMERRIDKYEKSTGVEIAIVTVNSLEGRSIESYTLGLFRKWGIGKKDQNNGVMILVSPNDRLYRIEVGYGLEGILTDALASTLGRNYLVPAFKEGQYGRGLNDVLEGVMSTIGYVSSEERTAFVEQQAIAKQQAQKKLFGFLGGSAIFFLTLFVIVLIYRFVRNFWRDMLRRRELRREITKGITTMIERVNVLGDAYDHMSFVPPKWYESKFMKMSREYEECRRDLLLQINAVNEQIRVDVDDAFSYFEKAQSQCVDLEKVFRVLENADQYVLEYRDTSQFKACQAGQSVIKLEQMIIASRNAGYRVDHFEEVLEQMRAKKAELTALNRDQNMHALVAGTVEDKSFDITMLATEINEACEEAIVQQINTQDARNRVARGVMGLELQESELNYLLQEAIDIMANLAQTAPRAMIAGYELSHAKERLGYFSQSISDIQYQNSIQEQEFFAAEKNLKKLEAMANGIRNTTLSLRRLLSNYNDARDNIDEQKSKAHKALDKAQRKTRGSDAGTASRSLYRKARDTYNRAMGVLESRDGVDYITALALLVDSENKAEEAYSKAKRAIRSAESSRESICSSSSSSSLLSSSTSSSVRFGGGNSGGGGATGGW